eukprot:188974-Alexandrium_andersonii.AAC.1
MAGSLDRLPTHSKAPGRKPAGAIAGAIHSTAKAAPKSTAWTSACGPTLTRPRTWRLSPRGAASG